MPENFNKPPIEENAEVQLEKFVERLTDISTELYPAGDRLMTRFLSTIKTDGINAARIFVGSESDKFRSYGEEAQYLIIDYVYDGAGSPWRSLEQKRKPQ